VLCVLVHCRDVAPRPPPSVSVASCEKQQVSDVSKLVDKTVSLQFGLVEHTHNEQCPPYHRKQWAWLWLLTAPGALSLASGNRQTSTAKIDVVSPGHTRRPTPRRPWWLPHKVFIWLCFLFVVRQTPFLLFSGENNKAQVHDSLQPKLTKDWKARWDHPLSQGILGHHPANRGVPKCTHSRVKFSLGTFWSHLVYCVCVLCKHKCNEHIF